jgi:uncharacterized protein YlaI
VKDRIESYIEKIDELGAKCCELYEASKTRNKPIHKIFRGHFCPECNLKLKTLAFWNWNIFACNKCGYKYCRRG